MPGEGVDPAAKIRYRTEILIKAPLRQIETDVLLATDFLGKGLESWLHDLKATAEARTGDRR
ncbi:hypothetical protein AB0L65_35395 [Nonomuraea sp. NPDC052116]|uniref:hypothetical protein n=1 Tax=Nonomuraea sp. NPDC052116 TaxID=3155665 RepID=UPI00343ED426